MKRVAQAAAIAALCLMLSGCLATVGTVVGIGAAMYCAGVSEAGKEVVRDVAAAGRKVIACEEAGSE